MWLMRSTNWFLVSKSVSERMWGNVVLGVLTLAYPIVVYLSLGRFEPRWLALLLLAMALVRLGFSRTAATWGVAAVAMTLAALAWVGNAWTPLKLYPVAVNAFMLVMFASTLASPPSAVERLARLSEPDLPEVAVIYTRKVTMVWCAFFLINGAIALGLAMWGTDAQWALYNGAVSYVFMGILGAGEWLVRQRVRGRHATAQAAILPTRGGPHV